MIIHRSEIDDILSKARVCRLALARENEPYLVPVFFGYDGSRLFFHTAEEGKKIEFIQANSRVCFEVENEVGLLPDPSGACQWSARFESVIGHGNVVEMVTREEKEYGLDQIMLHYSGRRWRYEPSALKNTRVWCVEIDSISGKRSDPGP